jgi:hypothetical protein
MNEALGYDFNVVEFAVKDGIPYAIDFCNHQMRDINSVGQANFDWIVEKMQNMPSKKQKNTKMVLKILIGKFCKGKF